MKISLRFLKVFNRYRRNKLRNVLRGYKVLKDSERLNLIGDVKRAFTTNSLGIFEKKFSKTIFGSGIDSSEIVVRQFLLSRLGGLNLSRALLMSLGKKDGQVIFAMPKAWRELLRISGFRVSEYKCAILWQFYVIAMFFYGLLLIGNALLKGIRNLSKKHINLKYVYFAGLSANNIPRNSGIEKSHDIISWYLLWGKKLGGIKQIMHSAKNAESLKVNNTLISYCSSPVPDLHGWKELLKFLLWLGSSIFIAVFDFCRGRWWHALLLNQSVNASIVNIVPKEALANEYLFHNSDWIYRPLWTYGAEIKECKITFYFYSTNCERFKISKEYPPPLYGWEATNWPNYLVWDDYLEKFVKRSVLKYNKIEVVGPIWFESNSATISKYTNGIAVFDVSPYRDYYYATLGMDFEFYTFQNNKKFLKDILGAVESIDAIMILKRKRKFGKNADPKFIRFTNHIEKSKYVFLVEPEVSAMRVIESSRAVISLPFTSTALIAKHLGKPSIYYDPTGLICKEDRAAHGIQIINSKEELEKFICNLK